jgi:hypothetical protein
MGVMQIMAPDQASAHLRDIVGRAVERMEDDLLHEFDIDVQVFDFPGPRLSPVGVGYSPLDFLRLGLNEKLERGVHFLLVITDEDLATRTRSYSIAMPSQLTNVGIISTKRLNPAFWGDPPDEPLLVRRLTALMLHTFGHLLNLPHRDEADNVMHDFRLVEELDTLQEFDDRQRHAMRRALPQEARDEMGQGLLWWFALKQVFSDWSAIWRAVAVANPLRLLTRLPTAITTALSVTVVIFFSAETWDVAGSVELYQLVIFAVIAHLAALVLLYGAFALGAVRSRHRGISESTVVTEAATLLSLLLTLFVLWLAIFGVYYLAATTIFPRKLMATWPTTDPAVRALDHIKLSMFLGSMGILAGSLGGRADRQAIVRSVLFLDEET